MSYRDVRNFVEMMRALGYPAIISMEGFRTPNFALVADTLLFLARRFDPDVDLHATNLGEEEGRIHFIRNAAQFMALKGNVKLNTKRLYQADGYAVKELLKITTLLYEALNANLHDEGDIDGEMLSLKDFDLTDKIPELKLARQLASEITTSGATLFDLLGKEVDLRVARQKSVNRQYELTDIEAGLKKAIEGIKEEIEESKKQIETISTTETSLDSKIERRKVEMDRYEKRLQTLKKVRPAFMEEFTLLEKELEELFVQYSNRTRILSHLEMLLTETERTQLEKQLEKVSPRIETIPLEGVDQDFLELEQEAKQERPRASTGGRVKTTKSAKYGAMQPPISPSLSSDTESDELFIDKDESELMHSDDESLGLELSGMEVAKRAQSSKAISNSDDDF